MKKPKTKKIRRNHRSSKCRKRVKNQYYSPLYLRFGGKFSLFVEPERNYIIDMIKAMSSTKPPNLFIDFKRTVELEPLSFLHFLHNLECHKDIVFKAHNFKALALRGVFEHFGLNKNFGFPSAPKRIKSHNSVTGWKVFRGHGIAFDKDIIDHLMQIQELFVKNPQSARKLITGISEAISNVSEHAYIDKKFTKSCNQWRLMTFLDGKRICVVVSDLGVSIPFRIAEAISQQDIEKAPLEPTDSELIQKATQQSSSGLSHRGKGFGDILSLGKDDDTTANEILSTKILVLSRRGSYVLNKNHQTGELRESSYKDKVKDFSRVITGTIVAWVIDLV